MDKPRPHVLAIDDGPFQKGQSELVPLVAVMMEGSHVVEAVSVTSFPVDGEGITPFLAGWIESMRCFPAVQAVLLGGITIAGLAVVDVSELARRLGLPVLVATRRDPRDSRVAEALEAAGLQARLALVAATPPASRAGEGLYVAAAGASGTTVARLVRQSLGKAQLPEALRVAHLFARALVDGESKGRA